MEKKVFNKQYFIDKFSALKDEEVGKEDLNNHCSLWHCGVRIGNTKTSVRDYVPTEESTALIKLLGGETETDFREVFRWNDGTYGGKNYEELPPRQRMLKVLNEAVD